MKHKNLANKRARKAQKRKHKTYQGDKAVEQALKRIQAQLMRAEQDPNSNTVFV